jgi:hypothetical protein
MPLKTRIVLSVGQQFGHLTVLDPERSVYTASGKPYRAVLVRCTCGVEKTVLTNHLANGATQSCGCVQLESFFLNGTKKGRPSPHLIEVGQRYATLTVLDVLPVSGPNIRVRCDCGSELTLFPSRLVSGHYQSCGCQRRGPAASVRAKAAYVRRTGRLSHGSEPKNLYAVWASMKQRCRNQNYREYHLYGGRGISICPEWVYDFVAFRAFALATGWKHGLHMDRIDNNGNYQPDNVRFVTPTQNARNKRSNRPIFAFGETKVLTEWVEDPRCFVGPGVLRQRIERDGWPVEKAIATPAQTISEINARRKKR